MNFAINQFFLLNFNELVMRERERVDTIDENKTVDFIKSE